MRRIVTILMLMLLSACGTSLTQESAELKTPWGGIDAVGPDGRSGRYGVTALNSGDSSVFRPGTTVSALTLYAADPKTKKEVVAPYVIGRAQGATVNTPFGRGLTPSPESAQRRCLAPLRHCSRLTRATPTLAEPRWVTSVRLVLAARLTQSSG